MRFSQVLSFFVVVGLTAWGITSVLGQWSILFWTLAGFFGVIQFFKYVVNS
jgi:hypothetical protein